MVVLILLNIKPFSLQITENLRHTQIKSQKTDEYFQNNHIFVTKISKIITFLGRKELKEDCEFCDSK